MGWHLFMFKYWHTEKPFDCCTPGQPRTSPSGRLSVLALALAGGSVQGKAQKRGIVGNISNL